MGENVAMPVIKVFDKVTKGIDSWSRNTSFGSLFGDLSEASIRLITEDQLIVHGARYGAKRLSDWVLINYALLCIVLEPKFVHITFTQSQALNFVTVLFYPKSRFRADAPSPYRRTVPNPLDRLAYPLIVDRHRCDSANRPLVYKSLVTIHRA